MINKSIQLLLNKINSLEQISSETFYEIEESYKQKGFEYSEFDSDDLSVDFSEAISFFKSSDKNYFTLSSKSDFSDLLNSDCINSGWNKTLIFHPLNNHSRPFLKMGDILYCYRQGGFSSLDDALNTRGIYGVGVAASNPLILFKEEYGYKQYGIVVCFPFFLKNHIPLKTIQLHPKTINLTPYNGNRNDSLQYIPEPEHYKTLNGIILQKNPKLRNCLYPLVGNAINNVVLPEKLWNMDPLNKPIDVQNLFDINKFIEDVNFSGLVYSKEMIIRFVSSLLSKNFLILTGLSGSGKTRLAQCFSKWITQTNDSKYNLLTRALENQSFKKNYEIKYVTPKYLEIINTKGSTLKIIPIPTAAIYEWFDSLNSGLISLDTDPKIMRHKVGEISNYQKYIHGFYNEMFKIASLMYELQTPNEVNNITQYKLISVGSDWINRDPLLGYPNSINSSEYFFPETGALDLIINANLNPNLPFFLILDEMNMSHVERYFSDFLSAMESDEKIYLHNKPELDKILPREISLPNNLFIIGTVNIDETTYMFSPKVLDRANVIEFRIKKEEMSHFFDNHHQININFIDGLGACMGENFVLKAKEFVSCSIELKNKLLPFFEELQKIGIEFGYRTATEISTFVQKCSNLGLEYLTEDQILDFAIMQKLLPKLHGSRNKLDKIIRKLQLLCLNDPELTNDSPMNIKYPISYEKLNKMYNRVVLDGFTSYAEA